MNLLTQGKLRVQGNAKESDVVRRCKRVKNHRTRHLNPRYQKVGQVLC